MSYVSWVIDRTNLALSPASAGLGRLLCSFLGLTPQALCCRLLRRLARLFFRELYLLGTLEMAEGVALRQNQFTRMHERLAISERFEGSVEREIGLSELGSTRH